MRRRLVLLALCVSDESLALSSRARRLQRPLPNREGELSRKKRQRGLLSLRGGGGVVAEAVAYTPGPGAVVDEAPGKDGRWTRPSSWSARQRRKALSLMVLTLQNSLLTLTMRYSRVKKSDQYYLPSEAVVAAEFVKACFSLLFAAAALRNTHTSFPRRVAMAARDAYMEPGSYVLLVPAFLYAVQNNLQYVAASNLEPAVFQLLYQMKLLTTAFFSVLLLGRRLLRTQWAAIALLALGLGSASVGAKSSLPLTTTSLLSLRQPQKSKASVFAAGFAAVFAACCTSGFSSVYFERVVKTRRRETARNEKTISVWARNAQLATFSTIIAAVGALLKDGRTIQDRGLLCGFDKLVWAVVILQAGGGLCKSHFFCFFFFFLTLLFSLGTAAVIAYADNLLKGFATGISLLICSLASYVWFDFQITMPFVVGASAVFAAIFLYSAA